MSQIDVLGVRVDKTSKDEVLDKVSKLIKEKKKFYIVTPNPEIILKAHKNSKLKEVINSAAISIPDGVGLKLADPLLNIIKGRELLVDLFKLADKHKLKVYLLGSTPRVNVSAREYVAKIYPDISVMASSGPVIDDLSVPISEPDREVDKETVNEINKFKPHLLFVAFGAPKQELWVARYFSKLNVGGIMVVGGAFDYLINDSTVPRLMESFGLEWLYRLMKEPERLGRILNAIIVFPLQLLLNRIK